MSLRYLTGYTLLRLFHFLRKTVLTRSRIASISGRFAAIVWTPDEIDRYSRAEWNSREEVDIHLEADDWLDETERSLAEKHFSGAGKLLNLVCGAGWEALLLANRGLRVTACDWSSQMIAAARSRTQEAGLPIDFEVADLYDLPYSENSFDFCLLPNISYSYLFPRRRRVAFLRLIRSTLKPSGKFMVSLALERGGSAGHSRSLPWLFLKLRAFAPFNREYEPGDRIIGEFLHLFRWEALKYEFEEARFAIEE